MARLLTVAVFLAAQYLIAWYGNLAGKVPAKGTMLGIEYQSQFVGTVLLQVKFLWLFLVINLLFALGFQWGFESMKHFVAIAALWIAAGPVAALLFNTIALKEPLTPVLLIGFGLVVCGGLLMTAHQEIHNWLS